MTDDRLQRDADRRERRLREASELARGAAVAPGVAELLQLYGRYAEMLRQAQGYVTSRDRVVIYSSGDASA